jgi:ATP-dependent DNA ligase
LAKKGTQLQIESDYAEQNDAKRSSDNTGITRCGIVRHSTLWLKPDTVAKIEILEWIGADHLRHTKFVALRDDKDPRKVVKEKSRDS